MLRRTSCAAGRSSIRPSILSSIRPPNRKPPEEAPMRPQPLAAALVALALAAPAALPASAEEAPRQISVSGSAQVEAVPDLATVSTGVETRAATAAEALAANSEAMTAVFAALEAAKVEKRDFQTSQLNLNPVFEDAPD